jgi:hypothetical protein
MEGLPYNVYCRSLWPDWFVLPADQVSGQSEFKNIQPRFSNEFMFKCFEFIGVRLAWPTCSG